MAVSRDGKRPGTLPGMMLTLSGRRADGYRRRLPGAIGPRRQGC